MGLEMLIKLILLLRRVLEIANSPQNSLDEI